VSRASIPGASNDRIKDHGIFRSEHGEEDKAHKEESKKFAGQGIAENEVTPVARAHFLAK